MEISCQHTARTKLRGRLAHSFLEVDDAIPKRTLVVACLAQRVAEPLKSFVETVARSSASGLDILSIALVREM